MYEIYRRFTDQGIAAELDRLLEPTITQSRVEGGVPAESANKAIQRIWGGYNANNLYVQVAKRKRLSVEIPDYAYARQHALIEANDVRYLGVMMRVLKADQISRLTLPTISLIDEWNLKIAEIVGESELVRYTLKGFQPDRMAIVVGSDPRYLRKIGQLVKDDRPKLVIKPEVAPKPEPQPKPLIKAAPGKTMVIESKPKDREISPAATEATPVKAVESRLEGERAKIYSILAKLHQHGLLSRTDSISTHALQRFGIPELIPLVPELAIKVGINIMRDDLTYNQAAKALRQIAQNRV